LVWYWRN